MIRTYIQQNSDWFANSDPFSHVGDMESEIAELRTLTKVTQLRKQIECKEEGAWMVVKDIPDDKAPSGTRKVTSYGMTKRSVTRSVSSNVGYNKIIKDEMSSEPLVQLADEELEQDLEPSTVEITEVYEEPLRRDIPEYSKRIIPEKTINKKTSVVTLGKGNLVLIDPEEDESNFHVTGISKGKVADVVSTLERSSDKKVKKVGFCKTEVHFAPDSGKINIVETDEKPPPTQVYRKKKKSRGIKSSRTNSCLPKHYFGEMDVFGEDSNLSNESDKEDSKIPFHDMQDIGVLSNIKEKVPTFERTIKSQGKDMKYRHSSPEKNVFDIEKIESEGKEFFKKVKQHSFREKHLKDSNYVPERLFTDSNADFDDIAKSLDKHPRLKDNLYIYGGCDHSKEKEILKSNCKVPDNDYATISNIKPSSNSSSNFYHTKKEVNSIDKLGQFKEEELGQNLRYTELFKFPSSVIEKDLEKQESSEKDMPEVRNIPIVQTNHTSGTNYPKPKNNSINDRLLDISCASKISVDQEWRPDISFLGNVSPKLQNLIQNSVEHEFQLRQKQILQKKSIEEKMLPSHVGSEKVKSSVTLNISSKNNGEEIAINKTEPKLKPIKIVTQVHLGPETGTKHEFQLKRDEITKNLFTEPIYNNKDLEFNGTPYLLNEEPVPAPRGKKETLIKKDSKAPPKPKPRTITSVAIDRSRAPKTPTIRVSSRTESSLSSKRVRSKESISKSKESDRSYSRPTISKEDGKCKKFQSQVAKSDNGSSRTPRAVKVSTDVKGKKINREPLRSFEKVSNGWVGHIVPLKQDGITVTTKVYSSKAGAQGLHSSGSKRNTQTSSTVKTTHSTSSRLDGRRESKQFSFSKEHLSSTKLVKEVSPRRGSGAKKVGGRAEKGSTVDSYRPRRRRESERSDDSVVQADEEVRAYMFDGHKNKQQK